MSAKKVLITSGRSFIALDLARKFRAAGYEVYTVDTMPWHLSRFSNAVSKSFVVPSPRLRSKDFIKRMVEIAETRKIDLIVPVYEEILYMCESRSLFPARTEIFGPSFSLLQELHSKWQFTLKQRELGFETPKTYLIQSIADLHKLDRSVAYALKASFSRASLGIHKLLPGDPVPAIKIEPHNPWIAQEWLTGEKFCSYTICRNGQVKAHSLYPVGHTANGQGCIVFKAVEHQSIRTWVETFVKKLNFTGQIAFDFIVTADKKVYAIECNPRATSGAHLFDEEDRLDRAFTNEACPLIDPVGRKPKKLGIAMLMYGWKGNSVLDNSFRSFAKAYRGSQDVVFRCCDPMPFLTQPLVLSSIFYNSMKKGLSFPEFFMYDYEWNGDKK